MKTTIWSSGYKPTREDLKGLFESEFETSRGLVMTCYTLIEKEERETEDCQGDPATCELQFALVGGIDISEVLDAGLVEDIEIEAMKAFEDFEVEE